MGVAGGSHVFLGGGGGGGAGLGGLIFTLTHCRSGDMHGGWSHHRGCHDNSKRE